MKRISSLLFLLASLPMFGQVVVGPPIYKWTVTSTAVTGQQGSYISFSGLRGPIPSSYSLQWVVSGTAPAPCTFTLEGSNNGVTWTGLDAGGVNCATSGIEYISNKAVTSVRVNLSSFTTGDATTVVTFNFVGSTSAGTGFPSTVPAAIASGGTGATTAAAALTNLGAPLTISNYTSTPVTTFTAETNVCVITIPANTLSGTQDAARSRIRLHASTTASGSAGSTTQFFGYSTVNGAIPQHVLASGSQTTVGRVFEFDLHCAMRSTTSMWCDGQGLVTSSATPTASALATVNVANPIYFLASATQTSSGDTETCNGIQASIY